MRLRCSALKYSRVSDDSRSILYLMYVPDLSHRVTSGQLQALALKSHITSQDSTSHSQLHDLRISGITLTFHITSSLSKSDSINIHKINDCVKVGSFPLFLLRPSSPLHNHTLLILSRRPRRLHQLLSTSIDIPTTWAQRQL